MKLPLAICTATHGLRWQHDEKAIPFAELDVCRTLLDDVPDFDAGAAGYEGVAAVGERVFAIRCFKASKWDFVGRDALYMAVTWLPRSAAEKVDFGALLHARELNEPMRNPPTAFEWKPCRAESDDAWRMVGAEIAEASADGRIRFVRTLHDDEVRRLEEPKDMTEAEKYLNGQPTTSANAPTSQTPAARFLKGEPPAETPLPAPQTPPPRPTPVRPNVALRVLAVIVFVVLMFVGTYFAKTRQPPMPLLGYVIGFAGIALGGMLWRTGRE